jgi:hypothetical protein
MVFKKYEKVPVGNWGQPWDCPKTQYVTLTYNLNRDCPKGCPQFCYRPFNIAEIQRHLITSLCYNFLINIFPGKEVAGLRIGLLL